MSARRSLLRANDLGKVDSTNEVLLGIYARLEALERQRFVDVTKTADAAGTIPPIVFAAPPWRVRAVYLAKLYDRTNGALSYLGESVMWEQTSAGISIPALYVITVSATYDITFELRGGVD